MASRFSDREPKYEIAIIGCGAAGVVTLFVLLDSLRLGLIKNLSIVVFEKDMAFGPGFAYQCDSDELLMNMVSSTTSIFASQETDFWDWVLSKGYSVGGSQIISRSGIDPSGYVSRRMFGLYLKSRFEDAISGLEKLGAEVKLMNVEVTNIRLLSSRKFIVDYEEGRSKQFKSVVLCIGNTEPFDIFNLRGKSQYINNPYPISKYVGLIQNADRVGIIGGQLTAADIAVVLANQGHHGPIYFLTRDLHFPLTRCRVERHDLFHLTKENINLLTRQSNGPLTVRQILRLARRDFLRAGIKWNHLFKPSRKSYADWLKSLLDDGEIHAKWQHLALETDFVIGECWNALSSSEKIFFMRKFHRSWNTKRVPLPVHTALKIYSLFRLGILKHHPYLSGINVPTRNRFIASFNPPAGVVKACEVECDWLINATGPSRDVGCNQDSLLVKNLLESGLIHKNPHGGVLIDYESSLVKDDKGQMHDGLYAVGHLTCGTYYYVSSLERVSAWATNAVSHLVASINSRECQQSSSPKKSEDEIYVS